MQQLFSDTIIALATPSGMGAIAIIRLSGMNAIELVNDSFKPKYGEKKLHQVASHSLHLGHIIDDQTIIDEVLVAIFKNPHSYTGEDLVEINCHGSLYIQQKIIEHFINKGARQAEGGEFTLRAFLNGKIDLSQAEAVADLIAANSGAAHQIAIQQMRGGFSKELMLLRQQLLDFASMIELELDFSEEDVEFANREQLQVLIHNLLDKVKALLDSFTLGNVFKNGIPVAIIGAPNAGKSTLLNALLNEDKAIVSEIAGTTRDAIEDEISIRGVVFRFIDTAGIRKTTDYIENIGIQKTFENVAKAQLVLYMIDAFSLTTSDLSIHNILNSLSELQQKYPDKKIIPILNKTDLLAEEDIVSVKSQIPNLISLSAKDKTGMELLIDELANLVSIGSLSNNQTIVSNSRHYEALTKAYNSLNEVLQGMANELPSDLLAIDIRESLRHLGSITGDFEVDRDLLGNIFANFCVGK